LPKIKSDSESWSVFSRSIDSNPNQTKNPAKDASGTPQPWQPLPRCAQYEGAEGILKQTGGFCCHENEI